MPLKNLVVLTFVVAVATLSVIDSYAIQIPVPSFLVGVAGLLTSIVILFMAVKETTQQIGKYIALTTLATLLFTMPLLWPLLHHP